MITIGSLYYLIPRLVGQRDMYSTKLIEVHFWIATIGVVIYIAAMWIAGVMQGLMWRATEPDGTLTYSFVESSESNLSFLCHSFIRWSVLLEWHVDHGLQRLQDGGWKRIY
jgi:cytochrome c oxidase cbb3-type subunit I